MIHEFGCRRYRDKVGVLVAQLGTPDAPTTTALRRYLREFLSDRRVIEVPKLLWFFILNCIVLRTRPKRSAAAYARVWTSEGSPLLLITKSQTEKLLARLRARSAGVEAEFGMRYGNPGIEPALDALIAKGCTRIVLLPMYPQYAAPTTASVYDSFFPALLKRRSVPTVRVVEPFFRHPAYIDAVAEGIRAAFSEPSTRPEKLLLSYHGMPKSYVEKGDPYCCMCAETTRLIKKSLAFKSEEIQQTFQSRFGKEPWLTPYTDVTVEEFASRGVKRLAVACPGFVADCLETVDEIGNEVAHLFKEKGGESLALVPCVNDSERFIDCLESVVLETAGEWISGAEGGGCEECRLAPCPAAVGESR